MTTFETNALEINDLNKNYPGFSLNHLNLTLPSGCILGLIGENGAGKTTTIKLILDIIKKDSGSIRILGRDCTSATTILKEEIGVVLDEVGFQECLTPLQIGRIMKDIFHNWDPSLYDQYLQKFNLPNKKEFGKFSKGMKMKLGIAVALSHHPNPDKPEKLFLFSTPCVILKKKGVFICYSLINTLIKFMASLPVMTA